MRPERERPISRSHPRPAMPTCAGLGLALFLAACGGDAPGEAPPAQSSEASQPAASVEESENRGAPPNLINDFRFEAQGVALAGNPPRPSELTLNGGCQAPNQLSLGFLRGNLRDDSYFYFSMNSTAPIGPGTTGVVEPVQLTWDNGVRVPDNLPPGATMKVPQRLEGTGRMTLTAHTGRGMAGRMAATVEGEVTGKAGTARVSVTFDTNLACGG